VQLGVLYDVHKHAVYFVVKHQYNILLEYFFIIMFHNRDQ